MSPPDVGMGVRRQTGDGQKHTHSYTVATPTSAQMSHRQPHSWPNRQIAEHIRECQKSEDEKKALE